MDYVDSFFDGISDIVPAQNIKDEDDNDDLTAAVVGDPGKTAEGQGKDEKNVPGNTKSTEGEVDKKKFEWGEEVGPQGAITKGLKVTQRLFMSSSFDKAFSFTVG